MKGGFSQQNFAMIIINFICIIILYLVCIYLFSKYMDMEEQVNQLMSYQSKNERQLDNLVKDINYNDRYIASYIENLEKSSD